MSSNDIYLNITNVIDWQLYNIPTPKSLLTEIGPITLSEIEKVREVSEDLLRRLSSNYWSVGKFNENFEHCIINFSSAITIRECRTEVSFLAAISLPHVTQRPTTTFHH